MKRLILICVVMLLPVVGYAQLEVKPGSFKEVVGFVNINTDIYKDDNGVLYAVIKVNTENINDQERRRLVFRGNESTSIELEYKVGEVWVYVSSKPATYLEISHPDYGSTEFWFPYDLQPKKGYEMVLVNNAYSGTVGIGSLSVTTKPESGATITLNGRMLSCKTPYVNDMIVAGRYEVSVSKERYKTVTQTIYIQDGDNKKLDIDMPLDVATISVIADDTTRVFIDDVFVGNGVWSGELYSGPHKILLSKRLNKYMGKTIMVEGGENQVINWGLITESEDVYIENPEDAWLTVDTWTINGEKQPLKLHPGKHEIICYKSDCKTDTTIITVVKGQPATYTIYPVYFKGKINITTNPPGATVYKDGKEYGTTPLLIDDVYKRRDYDIKIAKQGYITWKWRWRVWPDDEDINVALVPFPPEGTINALYSVSPTNRICFSKGNLQYQASTNTWRFAEHQWDVVGAENRKISGANDGWIDLYGWLNALDPVNCSENIEDYKERGNCWNRIPITNGGNHLKVWRIHSNEEWDYLLYKRKTASGLNHVWATVNGVGGIVLLPDSWSTSYYTLQKSKDNQNRFSDNIISRSDWTSKLEAHGAVFLPVTGSRKGKSVGYVGTSGTYWTASLCYDSPSEDNHHYDIFATTFNESEGLVNTLYHTSAKMGFAVRLVCFEECYYR